MLYIILYGIDTYEKIVMCFRWYICVFLLVGSILSASERDYTVVYTVKPLSDNLFGSFLQIPKESVLKGLPCDIINSILVKECSCKPGFLGLRGTCKLFEQLFRFHLSAKKGLLKFDLGIKTDCSKIEYQQFTENASCVIASLIVKNCIQIVPCLEFIKINPAGVNFFFKILNGYTSAINIDFYPHNLFAPNTHCEDIINRRHDNIKAFENCLKVCATPLCIQWNFDFQDTDQIHDLISTLGNEGRVQVFKALPSTNTLVIEGTSVANMLKGNRVLKILDLHCLKLNAGSITEIARGLRVNSVLQELAIYVDRINQIDVESLTNALKRNRHLKSLRILASHYDNDLDSVKVYTLLKRAPTVSKGEVSVDLG